ncbi:MAG: NAD(P)H-hydrate dehydratase [Huintestinicola sp.]
MYICTPENMKAAEAEAVKRGSSYLGLMENAGKAAADEILTLDPQNVLILCGKGNNGGDGFVIARLLREKGIRAAVMLLCGEPVTDIAIEEYSRLIGEDIIPFERATAAELLAREKFDVIADAVFGTGFHGELTPDISWLFGEINKLDCTKVAIDIPSGANASDGTAAVHTISCSRTVTFGAVKTGMLISPAKELCGDIMTADIGIDESCLKTSGAAILADDDLIMDRLPVRPANSHKGMFGKLLIIGGCEKMSGAACMNVMAALRSGGGIVRLASVEKVIDRCAAHVCEATFIPLKRDDNGCISAESLPAIIEALNNSTCAAIGSGMSVTEDTRKIVMEVIRVCGEKKIPLVIDADGLNCICGSIECIRNAWDEDNMAVLTPHIGEMSRLLGITTAEAKASDKCAIKLAELTGAVAAAKGHPTYIRSSDVLYAVLTGNPGLSRGGSGDVLTGIIAGLCASGLSPADAALCGTYLFGKAADMTAERLSVTGMLPTDVISDLPLAFKKMNR